MVGNKEKLEAGVSWWEKEYHNKQTKKNLWQVTSCLEREDWLMKRINRSTLSYNSRHACLTPCFFYLLSSIFLCSLLLLLHKPLCFDSVLYLYFKRLNYTGSRGENYGCFPLFLPTGTPWPLPGSINPPPLFSPSLPASPPTCPICLLSHSRPFLLLNVGFAVCICDWEEIIAKWPCLLALCTASWQRVFCR